MLMFPDQSGSQEYYMERPSLAVLNKYRELLVHLREQSDLYQMREDAELNE